MKRLTGALSMLTVSAVALATLVAGGALASPLVFVWGMSVQVPLRLH